MLLSCYYRMLFFVKNRIPLFHSMLWSIFKRSGLSVRVTKTQQDNETEHPISFDQIAKPRWPE